jgi:monoterpene epsilon-lactone hydrolase
MWAWCAGRGAVAFSEVAPVAMMLGSADWLRAWVPSTLGGLAADDEHRARLRETLLVFLQNGGSYKTTAERLVLHKNTAGAAPCQPGAPTRRQSGSVCSRHANHRDLVMPAHPADGKAGREPCPSRRCRADLEGHLMRFLTSYDQGRSSVSTEQRENLEAALRRSPIPVGSSVSEQRRLLRERTLARPAPADVVVAPAELGGVPAADITIDGIESRHVVLYFHGGVYVLGDAFQSADLASQIGWRAQARVISLDYRLAPEHPYPAAVDDALAAYDALLREGTPPSGIAFAGDSAGGGLAVATMVNARDHGLPLPAAAFLMSPYADLTLAGATMDTKGDVDALLSRELLQPRVTDYTAGQDPALGLISPVFADLSGLSPLIIQAGTHEVLLGDAVRLAHQAAAADVAITLDVTPEVPHVFQNFYPILDEAADALDRAGRLLTAYLASAARVTA